MGEIISRFLIGGVVVSVFAAMGDLFKPKSFAGLFGAAPSVALATLGMTIVHSGRSYATLEGRSMIIGAIALGLYCLTVDRFLTNRRCGALAAALLAMPLWFTVALCGWGLFLR